MSTLLLKNADVLVTMDAARREIRNGALFVRDNVIEQVGATNEFSATADRVIDAAGWSFCPVSSTRITTSTKH